MREHWRQRSSSPHVRDGRRASIEYRDTCSTTFCALWWSVSASAIATVKLSCFAQARSRSLPATPRCAAASAFVLHGATTRASTRLTVRVHLAPQWPRRSWSWCVETIRAPLPRPFWSPCGARPVPYRGSYRSFPGAFSGAVLRQWGTRERRRLTTCESSPSRVWYSLSFLLCVHFVRAHLTLKNRILAQKIPIHENSLVATDPIPPVHITPA